MYPLVAIVGATASGKSELALFLAEQLSGEIVNYDSVQIFRYLNVGAAKPTPEEQQRVPHHMIDIREPTEVFTAGDYQREARAVLEDIRGRNKLPILVGGTGLYLRALTEGLFNGPARSMYWRNRLEMIGERKGRNYLHRVLSRLDPQAALRIARRDKPKVIRALEVRLETGKALSQHLEERPRQPLTGFKLCLIGLNPAREELYRRIDERVRRMFDAGLLDEIRELLARGIPPSAKPFEAIGYHHVLADKDSCNPKEETIRIIQRDTRRYAKRQMTWFRKQTDVHWFDGPGDDDEIKKKVRQFVEQFVSVGPTVPPI
ncbi:MAG TPA: tRNA (adenosine(37)-N6)-dimethylallyltransferase MiaA [Terriglobia bacterium]|nr:tRNA (adenosine(37)-N6)-dimethylallyltransferase MiaA [Terriglobia bacterium]